MTRTIKFRAWDKKEELMHDVPIIAPNEHLAIPKIGPNGWELEKRKWSGFEVMQFTGLKDDADKDMYEGDVIEFEEPTFETQMLKCPIVFYGGSFCAYWDRESREDYIPLDDITEPVVIGNIYENPNLTK